MANNTLLASDNFVSGSLASSWGTFGGISKTPVIAGTPNVTEPGGAGNWGQIWTGLTWPNDQVSEVTINALTAESGTYIILCVRVQNAASISGYLVLLNNNTAALFVYNAGTPTQLGSTVSGLTIAAGDVWTLSASGAILNLYQNNKRILYHTDTTYTSGYPGYIQNSSVSATHTQVSSWRGYSRVQQDGVWQKQNIILPLLSGDITAGAGGVTNSSRILYEGNAQLLSGNVYKMWFEVGPAVWYAESTDGLNWTRSGSAVIASATLPGIIKVGSTYYMYYQPTAGTGNMFLSTSSDGIHWVQQSSTILSLGTTGQWDDGFMFGFIPVYIDGTGTWYALYTGGHNDGNVLGKLGLATSPNGLTWTKSASNPVQSNFWASSAIQNINGVWYMWGASNQPGQGGTAGDLDPTGTIRMQSTDLIHWSNLTQSIHNSEIDEGLNANQGQAFSNAIMTVGGKTYQYYTASSSDAVAPAVYQLSVAIAPSSVSSIVQFREDATTVVATDSFTNGNGPLSANWTTQGGASALAIVSGPLVEPGTQTANCAAIYTAKTFSESQYSEVTIHTLSGSGAGRQFIQPGVLAQSGSLSGYYIRASTPTGTISTSPNFAIVKLTNGAGTVLSSTGNQITLSVGDVLRLQSNLGSDGSIILSIFQNGYLVLTSQDYAATYTSGSPAILMFATDAVTNSQISSWAGGNASVIPSYPSGGSSSWLTLAEVNSLRGLKH